MVQILPASSSKSDPNVIVIVFHFKVRIEFSPQSRALLADLILPKCSERDSFSTFWNANRALAAVLCWQLSQIEARNRGNRDPTFATTEPLYPKNTGFRAWECFHLSQLLQTCIAGAPHKIEQRSRSALLTIGLRPRKSGAAPAPSVFCHFCVWSRALATVWFTFCRPHLSKVLRRWIF